LIVDFSNFSNSKSVISGGQSGLLNSKHYSDQAIQLFLKGKYHPTYSEYTQSSFPFNAIESIYYFRSGD
ncbi:MAG: penicillin acylase family protein, partial [Promethearchaeota archaeon]